MGTACGTLQLSERLDKQLGRSNGTRISYDTVLFYIYLATNQAVDKLSWSLVPSPPHRPDLVPSKFYLFYSIIGRSRGQRFNDIDMVKVIVNNRMQKWIFYFSKFQKLHKCIASNGNFVRYYFDMEEKLLGSDGSI